MKQALSVLGQTLLLLIGAVVFGILLPGTRHSPFHLVHVLQQNGLMRRQYEFDWLIGVSLLYFIFLLVGLVARRLRTSWRGSTLAYAVTLLIVFLLTHIGYKDVPLP